MTHPEWSRRWSPRTRNIRHGPVGIPNFCRETTSKPFTDLTAQSRGSTYQWNPSPDSLPPFSALTNDEDRERKAEYQPPGTYNVVVNPASFADLDEYRNSDDEASPSPKRRRLIMTSDHSSPIREQYRESSAEIADPGIVILKRFEDSIRKLPTLSALNTQFNFSPMQPLPSQGSSHAPSMSPAQSLDMLSSPVSSSPLLSVVPMSGTDYKLVTYYQTFVHRHLAQVHRDSLGTSLEIGTFSSGEVFEKEAVGFRPVSLFV